VNISGTDDLIWHVRNRSDNNYVWLFIVFQWRSVGGSGSYYHCTCATLWQARHIAAGKIDYLHTHWMTQAHEIRLFNLLKAYWLCDAPTGLTYKNFTFCHTVFVCFVFTSGQVAAFALYNANWFVFITEMKSVYCAVQTGSVNKAVCALSLKGGSSAVRCIRIQEILLAVGKYCISIFQQCNSSWIVCELLLWA